MSVASGDARRLTVRRTLVRSSAEGTLLRAMRVWLVRRVLFLGAVLVVLCLFQVWIGLQIDHLGYDLSLARQMELRLEHEQRELEVELATLRDPHRIAEVARRQLGLAEAKKGQIVYLP